MGANSVPSSSVRLFNWQFYAKLRPKDTRFLILFF
jgi:hypothetical protein